MNKNHDCGSCVNFQKWKNDKLSSGLCELYDARADTDRGRKCKDFKRIKFHRNANKNSASFLSRVELT